MHHYDPAATRRQASAKGAVKRLVFHKSSFLEDVLSLIIMKAVVFRNLQRGAGEASRDEGERREGGGKEEEEGGGK